MTARRGLGALLLLAAALAAGPATAQGLDPDELPPLPDLTSTDDAASTVAVAAAAATGEDVVVGAAKREQSLGSVASAVTVLSGDRLRRFGYRTVAEALRSAAGVFVTDDRASNRLGLRGLQILGDYNTRVLVLIDGATVSEPWNQFSAIARDLPLSIDEVDRIEIVRGPVSSIYGTNAFFGIINIVTRSADRAPRAWGRLEASTLTSAGGAAGFAIGGVDRQLRGQVFFYDRQGEDVTIVPDGTEGFTSDADGERSLGGALVGAWDGAFLQLRGYRRQRELPGAPFETVPGDDRTEQVDRHLLAEGGYSREVADGAVVTGRAYVNDYRFSDYLVYEDPADPDVTNFLDIAKARWVGGEARLQAALGDRVNVTVGGEVTVLDVESRSFNEGAESEGVLVPTSFDQQGLYAEGDLRVTSWLTLTAGARFDRNSLFDSRVSPRAALLLQSGELFGAKLIYADGFRNPSPNEAFFEDGIDFVANPDVRRETIRAFEAVLWSRPVRGLNLRLSGFHWRLEDLLELTTTTTPMGERLRYENLVDGDSTGVEVEATYRDVSGWFAHFSITGAVVDRRPRTEAETETPTNAPEVVAAAGVSTPPLFGRVHLSTEGQILSERRTRDPAVDAGAWVGWNAALYVPDLAGLDLTVGVRNIIGEREEVPAQEDYDRAEGSVVLIPGEGRELYVRLGYKY